MSLVVMAVKLILHVHVEPEDLLVVQSCPYLEMITPMLAMVAGSAAILGMEFD